MLLAAWNTKINMTSLSSENMFYIQRVAGLNFECISQTIK